MTPPECYMPLVCVIGVDKVEIARASIIGQPIHMLSPLVPSTHLLVGLVGVSIDDHQKFALKWAVLAIER